MTPTLDKEDEIAKWASQKNASVSKKPKLLEAGHPDNFQTPGSAIECLLPYLPKEWLIWEPACGKGNLVRAFEQQGYKVYGSDIAEPHGKDFLHVDCKVSAIITNPPFSIKEKFLARCYELDYPFALFMPITTFDSRERRRLFHRKGIQLILPDGRINFETPNGKGSSSWFYCAWFTNGLKLPRQLNFHGMELELV
jgi:hypothetical protein